MALDFFNSLDTSEIKDINNIFGEFMTKGLRKLLNLEKKSKKNFM